jgi:hypothetical protein
VERISEVVPAGKPPNPPFHTLKGHFSNHGLEKPNPINIYMSGHVPIHFEASSSWRLNETYGKVRIGKNLSHRFSIQDKKTNPVHFRPLANYIDRATVTGRRILVPTFADRAVSRSERG